MQRKRKSSHHRPKGNGHTVMHSVQKAARRAGTTPALLIRAAGNRFQKDQDTIDFEVVHFDVLAQEGPPPKDYQVAQWVLSLVAEILESHTPHAVLARARAHKSTPSKIMPSGINSLGVGAATGLPV